MSSALARLSLALVASMWSLAACAEPHWQTLRWPGDDPDLPAQPETEATAIGLSLWVDSIAYEPEAVVVTLRLRNTGRGLLEVERGAILLAWDELEYAPEPAERDAPEPARFALEPGAERSTTLRYTLGRALTGPGSYLIVRALVRAGEALVDLPRVELPAMPAP